VSEPSGAAFSTAYLVEHYWPGITPEHFRSVAHLARATAEAMARGGTPIRYLHSTRVPVDEAAFCVLDAPSMELIEELYAAPECASTAS
jgi:hypothetical protein